MTGILFGASSRLRVLKAPLTYFLFSRFQGYGLCQKCLLEDLVGARPSGPQLWGLRAKLRERLQAPELHIMCECDC